MSHFLVTVGNTELPSVVGISSPSVSLLQSSAVSSSFNFLVTVGDPSLQNVVAAAPTVQAPSFGGSNSAGHHWLVTIGPYGAVALPDVDYFLLREDSGYLLREDGGKIILE